MSAFLYRTGLYRVNVWQWLASKLPKRLVYFAVIRVWAYGTTGEFAATEVMNLTVDEAIRRWPGNEQVERIGKHDRPEAAE